MTSLDRFLKPIEIAGSPLGAQYKAYKMDSTQKDNNMRKMVDLGTCHCCDYFFIEKGGSIILLEETRLLQKVEGIRQEYDYLNTADKNKAVNNRIKQRMQLKAYGTMLVLCRLAAKYSSAKTIIEHKQYHFWVVASNINSTQEKRYFDSLRFSLRQALRAVLGKNLLTEVDVLSADDLKARFSSA